MKVLKFGGTSVGSVETLRNVKAIVEAAAGEQVIVVVSALGGLTDMLIATARDAATGTDRWKETHAAICVRHQTIIDTLVHESCRHSVTAEIGTLLDSLAGEYASVAESHELTSGALDRIVSFGERMSSRIISDIIDGACHFDSMKFIRTITQSSGRHILDDDSTQPLIHSVFDGWSGSVAVVPGFISTSSADGSITNLGRGGSDYTAAILAASLGARVLEIWTDVDGFLTADPRIIGNARVIDTMSFVEAMDLCNFGAKVIYPPTIYPVFHKNIPIYIKNTFNPEAPGTRVAERDQRFASERGFKGVSSISDIAMISLEGKHLDMIESLDNRLLNALGRDGIDIFPVTPFPADTRMAAIAVRADVADATVTALRREFDSEIDTGNVEHINICHGLAAVAVVGTDLHNDPMLTLRLQHVLREDGIEMVAMSREVSETNIFFIVKACDLHNVLRIVHDTMIQLPASIAPSAEIIHESE